MIARKRKITNEQAFKSLAKEFHSNSMKGYKDADALAEECDKLAVNTKEENCSLLVENKNREEAKKEPDISALRNLARQFSNFGSNYKNAISLANNCEHLALTQEQKNNTIIFKINIISFYQELTLITTNRQKAILRLLRTPAVL